MLLIYFVDDKLGGVSSLNYNLASHCPDNKVRQWVVHIEHKETNMARASLHYPVEKECRFQLSNQDNAYHILKRLHKLIPDEDGALVLNYATEMAMLDHFPVRQTVYQLVHDDYNVRLAEKYGHVVDVFICHNRHIEQRLKERMPGRLADIYYLPHGVHIPETYRRHTGIHQPLKLLFLGRITESKGIFDLPVIDALLQEQGIRAEWTCVGRGPQLEALKQSWEESERVRYLAPESNEEVMRICAEQDVFVLPTRFEGSPVSLLETMSAGLVPVISALPGGIMEVVHSDNGYTIPMQDVKGFAQAIAALHTDRKKLAEMGEKARQTIIRGYDLKKTAAAYHQLFADYANRYHSKHVKKMKIGARLDQPWMPSWITKGLRSLSPFK